MVGRDIRLGRIGGDALEPRQLGGLLGGAVRGADSAVDHDARLQQPGDDRAGHRTGAEEGDRGQCHGVCGSHATILGLLS